MTDTKTNAGQDDCSNEQPRSMPRSISLAVLIGLIAILGITFFRVIAPFLLPLFLAGVTAVLCQPLQRYFLKRTNGKVRFASGLTTAVVMLAVLIPLVVGIVMSTLQLYSFALQQLDANQVEQTSDKVKEVLAIDRVVDFVQQFVPDADPQQIEVQVKKYVKETLQGLGDNAMSIATTFLGAAAKSVLGLFGAAVIGLFIFGVALYYFLADAPIFIDSAERLIPVQVEHQRRLLAQFNTVVRAVVVSTFLAAIAQALLTAVMLSIVGFGHFFLFFAISTCSALIPIAGTWLVWVPCAIILLAEGSYVSAVFVILFGACVIGVMDNVIRAYVLNSDAKLHPLLALISVIGGLQAMGLWGVFIGPVVASILHGLMVIFNEELKAAANAEQQQTAGATASSTGEKVVDGSMKQESPPSGEATKAEPTKSSRKKRSRK